MKREKQYIVKWDKGSWDAWAEHELFVTNDLEYAKEYIRKFNRIMNAYKKFYKTLEDKRGWIKEEYVLDKGGYYSRWAQLHDFNKAFVTEIESRKSADSI